MWWAQAEEIGACVCDHPTPTSLAQSRVIDTQGDTIAIRRHEQVVGDVIGESGRSRRIPI
jgi:hypothetical protein